MKEISYCPRDCAEICRVLKPKCPKRRTPDPSETGCPSTCAKRIDGTDAYGWWCRSGLAFHTFSIENI